MPDSHVVFAWIVLLVVLGVTLHTQLTSTQRFSAITSK